MMARPKRSCVFCYSLARIVSFGIWLAAFLISMSDLLLSCLLIPLLLSRLSSYYYLADWLAGRCRRPFRLAARRAPGEGMLAICYMHAICYAHI